MKREQDIRELLISNTVCLIADGGFERATTRAITHSGALPDVKMNEAYIYRIFGSKEHLYETAFESIDQEFLQALRDCVKRVENFKSSTKENLRCVFLKVWRYVMNNEVRCRCYIRYYHSVYFKGNSLDKHNKLFEEIIPDFAPLFNENADVRSIMHCVLITLLDFAVRVYNRDLDDSETNLQHIFNVLFNMMKTYFNDEIKKQLLQVV